MLPYIVLSIHCFSDSYIYIKVKKKTAFSISKLFIVGEKDNISIFEVFPGKRAENVCRKYGLQILNIDDYGLKRIAGKLKGANQRYKMMYRIDIKESTSNCFNFLVIRSFGARQLSVCASVFQTSHMVICDNTKQTTTIMTDKVITDTTTAVVTVQKSIINIMIHYFKAHVVLIIVIFAIVVSVVVCLIIIYRVRPNFFKVSVLIKVCFLCFILKLKETSILILHLV